MPHIIVEHSSNISITQKFLQEIQTILHNHKEGNFDLEACKARSISFEEYLVGSKNQEQAGFLHISVKILEGRSVLVKQIVAKQIADFAKEYLEKNAVNNKLRTDLSVDFIDMTRDVYQKITL